ncbi:MAG: Rrf2 family transcriptional regulator [Butyrivibrio sp.]|nr:Rrf2 family transcriptional regulator [Butyrivibrio sp.]
MKISTKGRYALRVMIDLASNDNGEFIALKDIAQRQNITIKYLEQIVSGLKKAGYLKSMRGGSGGHRLAKAPSEYNVGEILRVMEGTLNPVSCSAGEDGLNCPLSASCHTIEFWKGLDDAINQYVDSFTLADLLEQK